MQNFQSVRVNGAILQLKPQGIVSIVGKVINAGPEFSTLQTSDGAILRIKMSAGNIYTSTFVEVVGRVEHDEIGIYIFENASRSMGDNFDLDIYNSFILLANGKFSNLFEG